MTDTFKRETGTCIAAGIRKINVAKERNNGVPNMPNARGDVD